MNFEMLKALVGHKHAKSIMLVIGTALLCWWARVAELGLRRLVTDLQSSQSAGVATIRSELATVRTELKGDFRGLRERVANLETWATNKAWTVDMMDIRDDMVAARNTNNWIPDVHSIHRDVIRGRAPIPRRRLPE